jgi:hypothetical protein
METQYVFVKRVLNFVYYLNKVQVQSSNNF